MLNFDYKGKHRCLGHSKAFQAYWPWDIQHP